MALCLLSTAIISLFACENTVNFKNTAPGDLSMTPSKCYIAAGGTVRIVGLATDADGDSLTYFWNAPAGTFTAVNENASQVDWTAPATPGPVVITMTVSDEIAAKTLKKTITVCELLPYPTIMSSRTIASAGHYYITSGAGSTLVPGNVTVTIEPGVTIVIDLPAGGLAVSGQLIAVGTAAQKIKFLGNTCGSETGLWSGIYFTESEAQGTMRYCDVSGGMDGVTARDGAAVSLRNCQIFNQLDFGVSSLYDSYVEIRECSVWENGDGILVFDADAQIRRSSIRYNGGDGIVCNQSEDVPRVVAIDSCVVANNYTDGIELGERAAPEIHYCSIFANDEAQGGSYAVRLAANISPQPIHAENNYWGLGNDTSEEIAALILDANDNEAIIATVSFTPWLAQAPVARAARGAIAGGPWAR